MESIITFLTPKKATFYISTSSTLRQALEKFDAHKFTVVPLIDENGKFRGTLSQGDILRYIKRQGSFNLELCEYIKIKDLDIYRPYKSLKIDAGIEEVLVLSLDQNFIPVVDDMDTYIGIIKRKEVIKYLLKNKIEG